MDCVYASPDVMEEHKDEKNKRSKWMYPLSHLDDGELKYEQQLTMNEVYNAPNSEEAIDWELEEERERRLLTDTIYDIPDLLGGAITEEEPDIGCVLHERPETTGDVEPVPEKKRGLFSRLFGGKRK